MNNVKVMERIFPLLVVVLLFSGAVFREGKITVAVAANAQFALEEIKVLYEKETGLKVDLVKGASGKLTAQIREGAPFDVFVSADTVYPHTLNKEGLTAERPQIYAYGALVLWAIHGPAPKDIHTLHDPLIRKVAIANSRLAPYGEAAVQALKYYKLYDKIESRLVYGESLSQVSQYVLSGAAQAAFTSRSIVVSAEMKGQGKWIEVDSKAYSPLAQSAVLLKSAPPEAKKFYRYLFSPSCKSIWKKYGYRVP